MPHRPRPIGVRLLLRLYPGAYRTRFGDEVADLLCRERSEARWGVDFWLRALLDHGRAAWAVRARTGRGTMRRIGEDLGSAFRSLCRAPLFVFFAVGTLGLGIGATTAVFTMLDRVVLRPLPFEGSERLFALGAELRHNPGRLGPLSPALMRAFEDRPGPAERVAGVGGGSAILTGRGDPSRVDLTRVTRDYFEIFQGRARVGRLFARSDHEAGAARVALLGYGFWTERFGADPAVVGSSIELDGEAVTVVGVLDDGFLVPARFAGGGDVWLPLDLRNGEPSRGSLFLSGVARLGEGATADQLDALLGTVAAAVYPAGEEGAGFVTGVISMPLQERVVGDLGATLGRVMAAVALLLLIACVNAASLLLTRGAERVRELAVRTALGASRVRLVRQLLAESVLLALAGGALGGGLALGAVSLFRRAAPEGIPRLAEAFLDARGFGFSLALGAVTVLAFGLVPALRAAGLGSAWASGARGATHGRGESRLRGTLVLLETALAVVLVVGSGLLAHDLARIALEDPGFERSGLVSLRLDLNGRPSDEDQGSRLVFWEGVLERARTLPGVSSAALATELPYTSEGILSLSTPEGWEEEGEGQWVSVASVAGDYLGTMGMRLVGGRDFEVEERRADGPRVALVNEAFVRRYWSGDDPLGKRVKSGGPDDDEGSYYDIVGVVSDVRYQPGEDARARMYVPIAQEPWRSMDVLVRAEGELAALAPALRAMVRELDPGLPVSSLTTVESLASRALAQPRFYTALFGGFALVALLLAVVGVYGTTAYATRSRTREIGIRLALGAREARVVRTVVGRTGMVLVTGVAFGLVGAAVSARLMADVLLRVDPRDVFTYGIVGLTVLSAGLFAAWVPAARAGRVDPARTLREEC